MKRVIHVVAASVLVELALDFGAGALAVILAPYVGNWVYAVAGVIVVGSLPVLGLNIARVGLAARPGGERSDAVDRPGRPSPR